MGSRPTGGSLAAMVMMMSDDEEGRQGPAENSDPSLAAACPRVVGEEGAAVYMRKEPWRAQDVPPKSLGSIDLRLAVEVQDRRFALVHSPALYLYLLLLTTSYGLSWGGWCKVV